jgi:hypothetical protein
MGGGGRSLRLGRRSRHRGQMVCRASWRRSIEIVHARGAVRARKRLSRVGRCLRRPLAQFADLCEGVGFLTQLRCVGQPSRALRRGSEGMELMQRTKWRYQGPRAEGSGRCHP